MELYIAGGCGEHGRNCFMIQTGSTAFLVDCGMMAEEGATGTPRLNAGQISRLQTVFLTHSHADHSGALPWLYEQGFEGIVVAAEETLAQLPFSLHKSLPLGELCPGGFGAFNGLGIHWGRSGHCVGSVWYRFSLEGKNVLFSGDYVENTLVYRCDPIRKQAADLAVLDCAYGRNETSYASACAALLARTKELLERCGLLLFPVPKYGRGLELLALFNSRLSDIDFYGDKLFIKNLSAQRADDFWLHPIISERQVRLYDGQKAGIVFVSDPQLRTAAAQKIADKVLSQGGRAVMTGTVEAGSFSALLMERRQMEQWRYPVHQSEAEYQRLLHENRFVCSIPYHSADYSCVSRLVF